MATTFTYRPYKSGVFRLMNRSINFISDTIRVALLNTTYVPNATTHTAWSDVSAHEITGQADYSQQTLGAKVIAQDGTGKTALRAGTISFGTSVSISARYALIYADLAGAATGKWLLGYIDLNEGGTTNIESLNQVFEIEFNAEGFYKINP